ncbi:hypothetical protein OUZ56_013749 [Daphnia magna]|uniref:Uncharacterized protein n=1 Tax=Daphnia magna TaxID=35525 RepID=A0ABQ9Z6U3_9CRUS|nr:hypothetical protein OUZ56_013749 [Daphnia magna]
MRKITDSTRSHITDVPGSVVQSNGMPSSCPGMAVVRPSPSVFHDDVILLLNYGERLNLESQPHAHHITQFRKGYLISLTADEPVLLLCDLLGPAL